MGNIREIWKKAAIGFPEPIGFEETQELIDYICKNLPGRANYHAGYHQSVGESLVKKGEFFNQRGTVDLAGMITRSDNSAFDGFNCLISRQEDTSNFEALAFQVIPGYDESDYNPEVLRLWDDVRRYVGNYFKQR
ncbi:Uncharacterised protein [uncultured archaeon]|nr:Uncharacterised protein [uncultured archaeon]